MSAPMSLVTSIALITVIVAALVWYRFVLIMAHRWKSNHEACRNAIHRMLTTGNHETQIIKVEQPLLIQMIDIRKWAYQDFYPEEKNQ